MTPEEQEEELAKIIVELVELWDDRGKEYGDALHDHGLLGQFMNIHRKYSRLRTLILENESTDLDLIEEEAEDLASYAIFTMLQVRYIKGFTMETDVLKGLSNSEKKRLFRGSPERLEKILKE